jgi:hypothetical protein
MATTTYVEISETEIPGQVRFDVPVRNLGQMVEVAYGGFGRAAHDDGDVYKRVHDQSIGPRAIRYFRRAEVR